MEVDPTRMCELLVGLPAVIVLGVVDAGGSAPLRVHVEMRDGRRSCGGCGATARVKERPEVELVELLEGTGSTTSTTSSATPISAAKGLPRAPSGS